MIPLPQLALALGLVLAASIWTPTPLLPAWSWVALMPFWLLVGRRIPQPQAKLSRTLLGLGGVLTQAVAEYPCGWSPWLETQFGAQLGSSAWPAPPQLLLIAPFVAGELLCLRMRSRQFLPDVAGQRRWWQLHLRMHLGVLAGLLLFLGLCWPLGFAGPLRVWIEEVSIYGVLAKAVLVVLFLLLFPYLLRLCWGTEPLGPPLQERLGGLARRAGVGLRAIRIWRTGGVLPNALVMGFTPFDRVVLFTDAMLASHGPRQLTAVFCHELGHCLGRHQLYFTAYTFGLSGIALSAVERLYEATGADSVLALLPVALVIWYLGFGWLSRRFELEADWHALRLTGDGVALISSLASLARGAGAYRGSWRYFPISFRCTWLRAAMADPGAGARLERDLRWSRRGCVALLVLGTGLQLDQWIGAWPAQRWAVEVRLKHYAAALERADQPGPEWEVRERLTRLAAGLDGWTGVGGGREGGLSPQTRRDAGWGWLAEQAQEQGLEGLAEDWRRRAVVGEGEPGKAQPE